MTEQDAVAAERERIVAQLHRVAEGRKEYADQAPPGAGREMLLGEQRAFLIAARIAEGDPLAMLDLVPSWRWTEMEDAMVRGETTR